MYILDTNICIYAMKDIYPNLRKKLLTVNPRDIYISSITVGELEYGAAKSKWKEQNRLNMLLFLSAFNILPFTEKDALISGKIRATLESQGLPIGPYDLLIASQGLSTGFSVVTHNTSEFSRVPSLNLEDWVSAS